KSDRDRLLKAGSFYLGAIRKRGGTLSINDVRDDDEFRTEDGRYFIAYQKRSGSRSKSLTPKTLKLLKDNGVIARKSDLRRNRTFGRKNCALLKTLLNA